MAATAGRTFRSSSTAASLVALSIASSVSSTGMVSDFFSPSPDSLAIISSRSVSSWRRCSPLPPLALASSISRMRSSLLPMSSPLGASISSASCALQAGSASSVGPASVELPSSAGSASCALSAGAASSAETVRLVICSISSGVASFAAIPKASRTALANLFIAFLPFSAGSAASCIATLAPARPRGTTAK